MSAFSSHDFLSSIWSGMINRCYNRTHAAYKHYGGRGIKICDRWLGPEGLANFILDMGDKPTPSHEIDRRDNNGNYEPGNCRWATRKEQMNNTRSNVKITHNGVTMNMCQWAEHYHMPSSLFSSRIALGWPIDKIVSTPVKRPNPIANSLNRKGIVDIETLRILAAGVRSGRKKLGLSVMELSHRVGCSDKALYHIERAENWPSVPLYFAICREFGYVVLPLSSL